MQAKKKSKLSRNGIQRPGSMGMLTAQAHAYLIRIPDRKDRERAIVAFLDVPRTSCRFPDNRFLVTRHHIEALKAADIPFEDIS